MISDDKHYEFVSTQARYYNEKMIEAFNLFLKLFSAIIGGSIWLSLQDGVSSSKSLVYAKMSSALVFLIALMATLLVSENLRAWHGYRKAMSKVGGIDADGEPNIPLPKPIRASITEFAMMVAMLSAAALYCIFNPFTL